VNVFNMNHPFERYREVVDVEMLRSMATERLVPSIRVNTLKFSVKDLHRWAKLEHWKLTPLSWDRDSFFIERTDRSKALGHHALHLTGNIYMQEAASMLPVSLLDPKPGESVLDLCAAPGSKSTQIAGRLQNQGVVVCNDPSSSRVHTLTDALHRNGVYNSLVMRRSGEWYGRSTVEQFDCVLCDAPCTAQGTSRRDKDALNYSSDLGIMKAAKVQKRLLSASLHACKIGGRIVYSTCTLAGQVELVDPQTIISPHLTTWDMKPALKASTKMQTFLCKKGLLNCDDMPLLRLWPQTENTGGFFCAVFKKIAPTNTLEKLKRPKVVRELKSKVFKRDLTAGLQKQYGTTLPDSTQLFEERGLLSFTTESTAKHPLFSHSFVAGLPLGKIHKHELSLGYLATLRLTGYHEASVIILSKQELDDYYHGKDLPTTYKNGIYILQFNSLTIAPAKVRNGVIKNTLPRTVIL
jgi:16S rRNA (cytosine1407-C5)-methyltransferase